MYVVCIDENEKHRATNKNRQYHFKNHQTVKMQTNQNIIKCEKRSRKQKSGSSYTNNTSKEPFYYEQFFAYFCTVVHFLRYTTWIFLNSRCRFVFSIRRFCCSMSTCVQFVYCSFLILNYMGLCWIRCCCCALFSFQSSSQVSTFGKISMYAVWWFFLGLHLFWCFRWISLFFMFFFHWIFFNIFASFIIDRFIFTNFIIHSRLQFYMFIQFNSVLSRISRFFFSIFLHFLVFLLKILGILFHYKLHCS